MIFYYFYIMQLRGFIFSIVMALLFAGNAQAQTMISGRETKKATVNLRALANYLAEHPHEKLIKPRPNDEDDNVRPPHQEADPSMVHLLDRAAQGSLERGHTADLPASPSPVDSFESTASDYTGIPPDTHGAVDSQYCVTAINTAIHIQSRGGYSFLNVSLDDFWNSLETTYGPGAYDPRVHYDPSKRRWIMVADAYGQTSYSMFFVAVSVTNDPTGDWHMYSINVDPTGAAWMDFPNVGYNKKWIAVTGNMFPNTSGGASGAVIYLVNYDSVLNGLGAPFHKYSESTSFSIAPTLTYDSTEPNLFMMENWDNTRGQLKLWKVSGSVSSPTLSVVGYPSTTVRWRSSPSSGGGDFLPQMGSTQTMDAGDDRITSCTYRNHKLWCSHTIFLPASGSTSHSSILWWQVDTTASPLQVGMINDPTAGKSYAYSSIAVNTNDDALIGFGYFSHSVYNTCAYALHMNTDPVDSIRPLVQYRHGLSSYYCTYGGGRNRWGDYSATCIDPRNDTDFWTIQETTITGTSPNWDTWWANVQFCPKPLPPSIATVLSPAPCGGSTFTYRANDIAGATPYFWTVSGTGWSGGSSGSSDSATVHVGTGIGTISVLAYNSCGEGEAHVFTVTPRPAPSRPTISAYTPACIGSATAIFSASAPGATGFAWSASDSGWSGSSSASSLTATVGSGTGMIICTASNTCGNSRPDTFYSTPAVTPTATGTVARHVETPGGLDTISFTGSAPAGSTYTWNFGGGTGTPGTGSGAQSVSWTVPGLKHISLTVTNLGCSSTFSDTVLVENTTAINAVNSKSPDIKIVPNPNAGEFDLLLPELNGATSVFVSIKDIQGKSVYGQSVNCFGNKAKIDAGQLVSGNYIVEVSAGGSVTTLKLTVAK